MHDGCRIDFGDAWQNPFFEFGFGLDPDLPQERVGHFAKERLHQIQPRAMLRRVHIFSVWLKTDRGE